MPYLWTSRDDYHLLFISLCFCLARLCSVNFVMLSSHICLYSCVSVRVRVCICVYNIYTCVHIHIFRSTKKNMYTYTFVYLYMHTHTLYTYNTQIHTHTHLHVCVSVCVWEQILTRSLEPIARSFHSVVCMQGDCFFRCEMMFEFKLRIFKCHFLVQPDIALDPLQVCLVFLLGMDYTTLTSKNSISFLNF